MTVTQFPHQLELQITTLEDISHLKDELKNFKEKPNSSMRSNVTQTLRGVNFSKPTHPSLAAGFTSTYFATDAAGNIDVLTRANGNVAQEISDGTWSKFINNFTEEVEKHSCFIVTDGGIRIETTAGS